MYHRKVLIVDDNCEWRRLIAAVLETEYDVVGFVTRGDEVISWSVALQPDIVTLDVSLPGIGGLRILPELRRTMPNAVIVIITTTVSNIYTEEAYQRGANGYVDKRKVLSDLVPAIEKAAMGDFGA